MAHPEDDMKSQPNSIILNRILFITDSAKKKKIDFLIQSFLFAKDLFPNFVVRFVVSFTGRQTNILDEIE